MSKFGCHTGVIFHVPSAVARLSRPPATTKPPPRLMPSADDAPALPARWQHAARAAPDGSHVHLHAGPRVRHLALPLLHRHSYAADIHHGLPAPTSHDGQGVPRCHQAGVRAAPSPYPPDLSWSVEGRHSLVPLVHLPVSLTAGRAVRQYRHAPALSGLLPPSPASPGSGCPQLHPAAATARRQRSFTSVQQLAPRGAHDPQPSHPPRTAASSLPPLVSNPVGSLWENHQRPNETVLTHATRQARHPSSDQLSRSPAAARSAEYQRQRSIQPDRHGNTGDGLVCRFRTSKPAATLAGNPVIRTGRGARHRDRNAASCEQLNGRRSEVTTLSGSFRRVEFVSDCLALREALGKSGVTSMAVLAQ
jgi:hypothetical protein